MNAIEWVYNDGGRAHAGFKGRARDCVCRAICIATGLDYKLVYDRLAHGNATQRKTKRTGKQAKSARNGIFTGRKWFKDLMREMGFVWVPTMQIGSGCKVHLRASELPAKGRYVVAVSGHYTAVIDGRLHDIFDCSRDGNRCVYGYWMLTGKPSLDPAPKMKRVLSPEDKLKAKVRDRAKALGARLEADELNVRVEAPAGHHWGGGQDVHELVCADHADALERMSGGTEKCGPDTCISWDFEAGCCEWHEEEDQAEDGEVAVG